jgi:hypothetical protein
MKVLPVLFILLTAPLAAQTRAPDIDFAKLWEETAQ